MYWFTFHLPVVPCVIGPVTLICYRFCAFGRTCGCATFHLPFAFAPLRVRCCVRVRLRSLFSRSFVPRCSFTRLIRYTVARRSCCCPFSSAPDCVVRVDHPVTPHAFYTYAAFVCPQPRVHLRYCVLRCTVAALVTAPVSAARFLHRYYVFATLDAFAHALILPDCLRCAFRSTFPLICTLNLLVVFRYYCTATPCTRLRVYNAALRSRSSRVVRVRWFAVVRCNARFAVFARLLRCHACVDCFWSVCIHTHVLLLTFRLRYLILYLLHIPRATRTAWRYVLRFALDPFTTTGLLRSAFPRFAAVVFIALMPLRSPAFRILVCLRSLRNVAAVPGFPF